MIYNLDTVRDDLILDIGIQGEDNARQVKFDISAWLAAWPGGTIEIQYKRPEDAGTYDALPSKFSVVDGILTWIIDINQTVYGGYGYAIITYRQGGVVRKSPRFNTLVKAGLPPAGPAPDTVADWIAEANTALNAIETLEFTINDNGELLAGETVLGRVSDNPRGDYNPDADPLYSKRDIVFDNGGSFVYINDTPSNEPTSSTSHWQQIASRGMTGPSAYDAAVAGGYSRGEADFYEDLARLDNAPPETWAEIQARVRDGTIDRYLMVGDQLIVPHATYGDIVFDITDISDADDAAMVPGAAGYFASFPNAKPLTLLTHDCLAGVQFSAQQANYKVLAAIPAGAVNITLTSSAVASGAQVQYDLTVPEGGFALGSLLRIKDGATNKLLYYATPAATAVEVDLTPGTSNPSLVVSPAEGAVLSAENQKNRVAYGSSNYSQSAIRQWLNSPLAKGTFWTPQSIYDLPPDWNATLDGFLKGLDVDFLSVIGATSRVTGNNTVTDGGGDTPSYTLTDRFFVPSRSEVGLGNEITGGENAAWPLFTSNAGRIKYLSGIARDWWLRSPRVASAHDTRGVATDGTLSSSIAIHAVGAAAACVIL